jgi:hypothetical protein
MCWVIISYFSYLYIYIYIYKYTYICMYIFIICVYIYLYIYTYMYIYIIVDISVFCFFLYCSFVFMIVVIILVLFWLVCIECSFYKSHIEIYLNIIISRLSCCINAFVFCVHNLCLIRRVYVFYVGHVDKIMKPFSIL